MLCIVTTKYGGNDVRQNRYGCGGIFQDACNLFTINPISGRIALLRILTNIDICASVRASSRLEFLRQQLHP